MWSARGDKGVVECQTQRPGVEARRWMSNPALVPGVKGEAKEVR